MKRVFLMLIALVPIAAATPLQRDVRMIVEKALAGEREAVAKYQAFAAKADEEGYPAAATLFRAQARAEQVHAKRFEAILREHGHDVPAADPPQPTVDDTADNLRRAAAAEAAERDGIYHEAIETCREHGRADLVKLFDQTRDSEVEHGNLCMAAVRSLDSMKQPKPFYLCDACGYTTDVKLPLCPACRSKKAPDRVE